VVAEIVVAAGKGIVVFVGVVEKLLWVVVVVVVTEEDSMYSLSTDLLVYNLVVVVKEMGFVWAVGIDLNMVAAAVQMQNLQGKLNKIAWRTL
jgi:hypothetical protein